MSRNDLFGYQGWTHMHIFVQYPEQIKVMLDMFMYLYHVVVVQEADYSVLQGG